MSSTSIRWSIRLIAFVATLVIVSGASRAQDPVKLAPNNYKVALDNEHVRVFTVTLKVTEKIAMHSHPDHVIYVLDGGKVKFTYPDGKTKEVEFKEGEGLFMGAETHASENSGLHEVELAVFELKKPKGSAAKAPAGDDQVKAAGDITKVVFENERVRLIETKLKPGAKMASHTHPAYVVYALDDAKVKFTAGGKTEEKSMTEGQAVWNEPTTHTVENTGKDDAHSLALEIKN